MGKRGPKPKPKNLRVFEGDPGNLLAARHEGEIEPPAELPPCPEWLGEVGQHVWQEVSRKLYAIGLLTTLDEGALALYCEAWDEFHAAREEIKANGSLTCMSEKGGEYQHPAVGIKNKAVQRIKQFGADFGMSPVARIGLKAEPKSSGDALDQFGKLG